MNSETTYMLPEAPAHPGLLILTAFPVACFSCALGTDALYALTSEMMWSDFSDWLLAIGMAFGVVAAIGGVIDAILLRRARTGRRIVPLAIGSIVVLALALLNNFVHSRDAWTSVVPTGIALSAITVLAIIITAVLGARPSRRAVPVQYSGVRP